MTQSKRSAVVWALILMACTAMNCSKDNSNTGDDSSDGNAPDDGNDIITDYGDSAAAQQAAAQYGERHTGQYHLGPVDFEETQWHNACAPEGGYRPTLMEATGLGGEYLAGVSNSYALNGGACDACIYVETELGNSIVARVVTYGITHEPGDIDVSPAVYNVLNQDEYPRTMSWEFAACPNSGYLNYEFQTGSNIWWTSLWVRNPKVPIVSLEVQKADSETYSALKRGGDGTFTDGAGFGDGAFTLRITAMDGQVVEETFNGFEPGELVAGSAQFE